MWQLFTSRFYQASFVGLWLCLLLLAHTPLHAQEGISFEAYVDARQVVLNGYFNVSFTLKNADGNGFKAPSFKDFVVAGGPSRSMSTTLINGVMSKEIRYSYTLRPRKKGKYVIGSASVMADGREMRTAPLTIEVVEGKSNQDSDRRLFVKAELSSTEAWIGQQIVLDYKLYTTVDVETYNISEESAYQGFYAEDIRRFDSRVMREVIDGVQYTTKVLKRTVLFPQQTGILEIDPMYLQMGISTKDPGRSTSFYFNRQIQRLDITTERLEVKVKPLPGPIPDSFTGAVGKFGFRVSGIRSDATTDDALSLKIEVSGNGDIKRVGAPVIDFPESFEVYDPKIIEENTGETGGMLSGQKVFEYFLLPKSPGQYSFQPRFTYFDVDSTAFITLSVNPLTLDITAGADKPGVSPNPVAPTDQAMSDIHFIKLDTRVYPSGKYFPGSAGFWLLFSFPFVGVITAFLVSRKRQQVLREDPGLRKSRKARKIALKRLEQAKGLLEQQNSRQFYDELSKALLGYIGDKLTIPLSELSKDNIREKISKLALEQILVDQVVEVIQTCEFALFAGKDRIGEMASIYERTLQIITGIEDAVSQ